MSETKFIPGPWAVDPDDRPGMEHNNFVVLADAPHMRICFMAHNGPKHQDVFDATAQLIAAAPDLYEALKPFAAALDRRESDDWPLMTMADLRRAAAALAKAEGRT